MIDREKIYKYLGYNPKENFLTNDIVKIVDEGITEINNVVAKKYVFSPILPVNIDKNAYISNLLLPGTDIKLHLENCNKGVMLCVTLGNMVDNLIRKNEATNMTKAVVLEAICNVLIEDVANKAEEEFRQKLKENNLYLTERFSPGYGDLPLSIQKDILLYTDAERKIGLTVTNNEIMIPKKSITAILGIANIPVKGKLAGCKNCVLKEKCVYRKRGLTCN